MSWHPSLRLAHMPSRGRFEREDRQGIQDRLELPREALRPFLRSTVSELRGDDDAGRDIRITDALDGLCCDTSGTANQVGDDVGVEQVEQRH